MTREKLEQLRAEWPIVRVLSDRGGAGGRDRTHCPLCDPQREHRQNFWFNETGWACHRCGEKGDVFKLVALLNATNFAGAVEILGGSFFHSGAHIPTPKTMGSPLPSRRDVFHRLIKVEREQWHKLSMMLAHNEKAKIAQIKALLAAGKIDKLEAQSRYFDVFAEFVFVADGLDAASIEIEYHLRRLVDDR